MFKAEGTYLKGCQPVSRKKDELKRMVDDTPACLVHWLQQGNTNIHTVSPMINTHCILANNHSLQLRYGRKLPRHATSQALTMLPLAESS